MSPLGRPEGESLSAQREGSQCSPLGRPEGESLSAQREGCAITAPNRLTRERSLRRARTTT